MLRIFLAFIILVLFSRVIPVLYIIFMTLWAMLSILILSASVEMGYLASTDPTIIGRFLFSMVIGIAIIMATAKIEDDGIAFGILAAGLVLTIGLCLPIF